MNASPALGRGSRPPGPDRSISERLAAALAAFCHPHPALAASVRVVDSATLAGSTEVVGFGDALRAVAPATLPTDVERLLVGLFEQEGRSLVRLARLFVDDRNAAEDLVQEAFVRLARSAGRIKDPTKAAAYLRSIVLNLARDHNRRGLVSLRHHLPLDDRRASTEDEIVLHDEARLVIDALRELPHRQRDCLVLRYYQELGVDEIAETLGVSRNSVKTHLKRGLAAMELRMRASGTGGVDT